MRTVRVDRLHPSLAVHITVEGMKYVYSLGAKKTRQVPAIKKIKPKQGYFSSLFGQAESNAPQRAFSPLPPQKPSDEPEDLKVDQASVVLWIFRADVDVELDSKLQAEIHRSTKKNPPRTLKYELIYVRRPPAPVIGDTNRPFRRVMTSMMRARRMRPGSKKRIVFSKGFAQT